MIIEAFVKLGQFLTHQRSRMNIPGRCDRWGCLIPVGNGSEFGEGPVCLICSESLRPTSLTSEEIERCRTRSQ